MAIHAAPFAARSSLATHGTRFRPPVARSPIPAALAEIASEANLAACIVHLHALSESNGRETPPDIELAGLPGEEPSSRQELIDRLGRLSEMGVSAVGMWLPGGTRTDWCDRVAQFGADVNAKLG